MRKLRPWVVLIAAGLGVGACDRSSSSERPVGPPRMEQAGAAGGFIHPSGIMEPFGRIPPSVEGPASSCGQVISPVVIATPPPSPAFTAPVVRAEKLPPAISGGTLLATADGAKLIAADPDRDAVYVIDLATRTLQRKIELDPSDEPGRVVQDKSGRVHVALRGGRSIASFDLEGAAPVVRTEVCDLPRGLAYDSTSERLYVACADGALVQLDLLTGFARIPIRLGRDLRDVIVRDGRVFVTRFRAAEILEYEPTTGMFRSVHKPPVTQQQETVFVPDPPGDGTCNFAGGHTEMRTITQSAGVAWRTIDVPNRGLLMLHQRASDGEVRVSSGGYRGGGSCASGIVRSALSVGDDAAITAELPTSGLFVDLAIDPTGSLVAVANPGAVGLGASVIVTQVPDGAAASQTVFPNCSQTTASISLPSQATAVAFVSPWLLAIQEREPAAISFYDTRTQEPSVRIGLLQPSREDTGHTLFHVTTAAGIACASCHAEAGDDGHVWNFEGIGPRRTQNLRGGILGSEPFHWNGDMRDFSMLVAEVFTGRMSAPGVSQPQAEALAHWIDEQPALRATPISAEAVQRGKVLFESAELGCVKCHAGATLRSNESVDVGTGARLQVPSLKAVSFRGPFMHDGCAKTLAERFGTCGGGDMHGKTSQLQTTDVGALIAYLESL